MRFLFAAAALGLVMAPAFAAEPSLVVPSVAIREGVKKAIEQTRQHFERQFDAFHCTWREFFNSRLLAGRSLTPEDYANLPRFAFEEEPIVRVEPVDVEQSGRQLVVERPSHECDRRLRRRGDDMAGAA